MEPAAALEFISTRKKSDHPVTLFTCRLYKLLLSTGKLIPCREDSTLVLNDPALSRISAPGAAQHPPKYYFAMNLRDNSVQMPQYTLSLLQTLLRLPGDSVFVSAYESNSNDGTHGWLEVLQLALNVAGIPSRLVARGMLVRLRGSDRIEHLARVRNMALAPLYQHYTAAKDERSWNSSSSSVRGDDSSSSAGSSSSITNSHLYALSGLQLRKVPSDRDVANLPPGVLVWDPDYVVFINDVFFCWGQVMRLLNHQADITCGLDFT
jgi:alpha-1,3-mannosyltransferase